MKKLNIFGHLLMILLCIGVTEKTYGMNAFKQSYQNFKQNFTWKKAAMAGIAGGCSLAQVGLAVKKISPSLFLKDPHNDDLKDEEFEQLPSVPIETEIFVREHLKNCGVIQLENLKVKEYYEWGTYTTKDRTWFFVPKDMFRFTKRCNTSISDDIKKYSEDRQKEAIASVHHEGGHIKNKDNEKLPLATVGFLAGNAAMSFWLRKKIIPKSNYWRHNLAKIASGLTISNLNVLEYYQFTKYCELKADDNVQNNIHTLRAAKKIFERDLRHMFLYGEYRSKFSPKNLYLKHPHPKVRIKRFKKRIKALKEKGDPEAFEDPLAFKESEIK